jgi:hypothetical protein
VRALLDLSGMPPDVSPLFLSKSIVVLLSRVSSRVFKRV